MTTNLIYGPSAQGGDKENCSVGVDNSNICKDVVIEMELMQSQVENGHPNKLLIPHIIHAIITSTPIMNIIKVCAHTNSMATTKWIN